jgi:hypothetical protein
VHMFHATPHRRSAFGELTPGKPRCIDAVINFMSHTA